MTAPVSSWKLPAEEFSYIGRPAETFEGRWAAIEQELAARFGGNAFALIDLGSCNGYFSLNTALRFPSAEVVGVEGSVGVGNGVVGASTRNVSRLVATGGAQTHMRWAAKLGLERCFLAPEVWDLDHIEGLHAAGLCADAMLQLSVVHHIDGICEQAYSRRGLDRVQGSLTLLAALMRLADVHVLELPDRPWLDHLHDKFETPCDIIDAATALTGEAWERKKIYRNDWLGSRELWLIGRKAWVGTARGSPLRPFFPVLLPGDEVPSAPVEESDNAGATCSVEGAVAIEDDEEWVDSMLRGRWRNQYGSEIDISGAPPSLHCEYSAAPGAERGTGAQEAAVRLLAWAEGEWVLETPAGRFTLVAVSAKQLEWFSQAEGWTTRWSRV